MKKQIHKRLPKDFVEDVIRTFSEEKIGREQACELLELSKAQFYRWKEKYSAFNKKGERFKLYNRESKPTRFFPKEVQDFLHEELYYITRCEGRFKNKFNFSFLAERAEKKFTRPFSRNSIRRFALRHAYYHAKPSEKKKVYIRFETPGPGFLFQHDTSHHIWLPLTNSFSDLILTKDDYSRKVVKINEAEKILDELISFYNEKHVHEETGETPNERYKKGIREGKGRLRPLSEEIDLDYVFSLCFALFRNEHCSSASILSTVPVIIKKIKPEAPFCRSRIIITFNKYPKI